MGCFSDMWERAWAVRGSRDVLEESKKVWSPWWRSRWTSACVKEYEWEILEWRGWRRFYAGLRTSRRQPTTSCAHQLKLGPSSNTSTSSVNLNFAAQRKLDINFNQTFDIILQIWKWKICAHQRTGFWITSFEYFNFLHRKMGMEKGKSGSQNGEFWSQVGNIWSQVGNIWSRVGNVWYWEWQCLVMVGNV